MKKANKIQAPVQPTSANMDRLLREMSGNIPSYSTPEIDAMRAARDDREKQILANDKKFQELSAKLDKAREDLQTRSDDLRRRIRGLRQRYLSEGVTPRVAKMAQELVAELNPGT